MGDRPLVNFETTGPAFNQLALTTVRLLRMSHLATNSASWYISLFPNPVGSKGTMSSPLMNKCTHSSCYGLNSLRFASVATTVCIASSSSSTAAIVVTTFQNKSFTSMPLHSAIPTGRRLVRTFRVAESLISQIGFPDYNVSENLASTKQASKAKLMFWELLWHSMKSHHITAWLCQHGPGRQQLVWPAVQMGFLNWGGR